jgi:ABC-type uncharacterized transport system auxiliary subunit
MTSLPSRALIVFLPLVLFGCVTISQPAPQIRDYRLDYESPAIDGPELPVVISIPTLSVAAAYDRESIVYRQDSVSLGRYFYHRWASNPGSLIADLLVRDFAKSGRYRAVQSGRSPLRPDYLLVGSIEEIEERLVEGNQCNASLLMRIELIHARPGDASPVLLQRSYSEREPCACEDPRALSTAMSAAMARISASLQGDVNAAIGTRSGP